MRFRAKGTFVIDSWEDLETPPSDGSEHTTATFTRTYSGDFSGSGRCHSVTSRSTASGSEERVGIEVFEGTVQGRTGQCSLVHRSEYGDGSPWLRWTIVRGEGGLAGIRGHGEIVMTDGQKSYSFEYDFGAPVTEPEPKPKKRHKRRFWAP